MTPIQLDIKDFMEESIALEAFNSKQLSNYREALQHLNRFSPTDLSNPETVTQVNKGFENLALSLGVESAPLAYLVGGEVSEESIGAIFLGFIKKIMGWLKKVADFFLSIFRRSNIDGKAQVVTSERAAKSIEKKAPVVAKEIANDPSKGKVKATEKIGGRTTKEETKLNADRIVYGIPPSASFIFHSRNHMPVAGFVYDDKTISNSLKEINESVSWATGKFFDEINILTTVYENILRALVPDSPVTHSDFTSLFVKRPSRALSEDNWRSIALSTKVIAGMETGVNVDLTKLEKLTGGQVWDGDKGVVVDLRLSTIGKVAKDIAKQVTDITAIQGEISRRITGTKFFRNTNEMETKTVALIKSNLLDSEKQETLMGFFTIFNRRVSVLQENLTMLSGAMSRYTAALTQLLSGVDRGLS